jgi:hypothetical protein
MSMNFFRIYKHKEECNLYKVKLHNHPLGFGLVANSVIFCIAIYIYIYIYKRNNKVCMKNHQVFIIQLNFRIRLNKI